LVKKLTRRFVRAGPRTVLDEVSRDSKNIP